MGPLTIAPATVRFARGSYSSAQLGGPVEEQGPATQLFQRLFSGAGQKPVVAPEAPAKPAKQSTSTRGVDIWA